MQIRVWCAGCHRSVVLDLDQVIAHAGAAYRFIDNRARFLRRLTCKECGGHAGSEMSITPAAVARIGFKYGDHVGRSPLSRS
ncbi:MAG: hypothetical protein H6873_05725 [Hyphomicrobiaceae bacterium]|nr:hypothetical protein [Hyphomicrobiaceae bacterium]